MLHSRQHCGCSAVQLTVQRYNWLSSGTTHVVLHQHVNKPEHRLHHATAQRGGRAAAAVDGRPVEAAEAKQQAGEADEGGGRDARLCTATSEGRFGRRPHRRARGHLKRSPAPPVSRVGDAAVDACSRHGARQALRPLHLVAARELHGRGTVGGNSLCKIELHGCNPTSHAKRTSRQAARSSLPARVPGPLPADPLTSPNATSPP